MYVCVKENKKEKNKKPKQEEKRTNPKKNKKTFFGLGLYWKSKIEHKKMLHSSTLSLNSLNTHHKMSALSFSFRPELIPAYAQAEFLTRVCQLVLDYQVLTAPVPVAPPAESLPQPSFPSADGEQEEKPKKERKNPWATLTEEQRNERLAAMKRGRELKAAERRLSADSLEQTAPATAATVAADAPVKSIDIMSAFELFGVYSQLKGLPAPSKGSWAGLPSSLRGRNALIAEIRRLQEQAALAGPAHPAALAGPAHPAAEDAASETSSQKKRKNPWADLTPEQKAERVAKMHAARKAKKEAKAAEGSA